MSFKFCPECGFKFDKEYKFCPECGYKLGDGEKAPEPLFDFSDDTAAYEDAAFDGFDEMLKKNEEKELKSAIDLALNKDCINALPILKKFAEKGNAEAQYNLGYCYDSIDNPDTPFGDLKQAAYWYQKSAEQGNANAMYVLAMFYGGGMGVSKDEKQERYWLQKAADLGHEEAMEDLGIKKPAKLVAKDKPKAPEKKGFDVVLTSIGSVGKVSLVKVVQNITGFGLIDAKNAVDDAPTTLTSVQSKEAAEAIVKQLTAIGAKAEIK